MVANHWTRDGEKKKRKKAGRLGWDALACNLEGVAPCAVMGYPFIEFRKIGKSLSVPIGVGSGALVSR